MTREFVLLETFESSWKRMNLDDVVLRQLQQEILSNPQQGKVIQGTGGLRKMRFAYNSQGKSAGLRVLYVDILITEEIYMIYAYPKSKKENITDKEKQYMRQLIEGIKRESVKKVNK